MEDLQLIYLIYYCTMLLATYANSFPLLCLFFSPLFSTYHYSPFNHFSSFFNLILYIFFSMDLQLLPFDPHLSHSFHVLPTKKWLPSFFFRFPCFLLVNFFILFFIFSLQLCFALIWFGVVFLFPLSSLPWLWCNFGLS